MPGHILTFAPPILLPGAACEVFFGSGRHTAEATTPHPLLADSVSFVYLRPIEEYGL